MAIHGSIEDMSLADLIQYVCADRQTTAELTIKSGDRQANLFFDEGMPVHAISGTVEGEEAVYEALTWTHGSFTVENDVPSPSQTIERSWKYLILEGMRRLDEQAAAEEEANLQTLFQKENETMANINETLAQIMNFDGAIATALVDFKSGMTLGTAGGGINIEMAAAGNTQVVRAKMAVMKDTGIKGPIEDILITLPEHYHLIRFLESNPNLFIYVAVHRDKANLGLARVKLATLEKDLVV
jgi:hypothetical protein